VRRAFLAAALALATHASACRSDPPSRLRVHLDAQALVKERARGLRVRVWSGDPAAARVTERAIAASDLPGTVVLLREGAPGVVFEAALLDAFPDGAEFAWTRVRADFVPGELREIALCFEDVCRDIPCNPICTATEGDAGTEPCTRCTQGRCVDAVAELLPPGAAPVACAAACVPAAGEDGGETECGDGADGDCDDLVDCDDPDCEGVACGAAPRTCTAGECGCPGGSCETECGNEVDDDSDGALDCGDSDCAGQPCGANGRTCTTGACVCPGGRTTEKCDGGEDLDCDGLLGCADPDCDRRACAADLSSACCGGSCVSVQTAQNCGACDLACAPGRVCSGGNRPACRCTVHADCPDRGVYRCEDGQCRCQGVTACTGGPSSHFECVVSATGNFCRPLPLPP
jgi:hypothetical protein